MTLTSTRFFCSPQNKGGKEKSTKTGLKVKELQDSLPNARIVYASATGASEPRNMAYMVRLGTVGQLDAL